MKTKIHVNQHIIKRNDKTGERNPTLTVKTYKSNDYAYEVEILGPSKVVYHPENPLPCGAKVWIETDSKVNIISEPPKIMSEEDWAEAQGWTHSEARTPRDV
jgi:hypothetical protein